MSGESLNGERFVIEKMQQAYPSSFEVVEKPPACIYGIGNPAVLREGLAIVGARKASSYGLSCARRFAKRAAEKGVIVISGGALGCDAEAHRGALEAGGPTLVFLGGGCDRLYPAKHRGLFQDIIDGGGAVVSEHSWEVSPRPYMFRMRNRLIASLSKATLIVEAGVPSGTFSTADDALASNRDVLAIPGPITSPMSAGTNRLIQQGAVPIIDDESFDDALFSLFGVLKQPDAERETGSLSEEMRAFSELSTVQKLLFVQLQLGPQRLEDLLSSFCQVKGAGGEPVTVSQLLAALGGMESKGLVQFHSDGRYALK